jgi:hypothetical protein
VQETEAGVRNRTLGTIRAYAPLGLSLAALVLWYLGIRDVSLTDAGDLGLISILSWPAIVAYLVLLVSLVWGLAYRRDHTLLPILQALVLIVMLFGVLPIIRDMPGYRVAYRHVGIVDYVAVHGGLDPRIDAYFNWPGFFTLFAFIQVAARSVGLMPLLDWASVIFNILYLPALVMLFRAVTDDRRIVWSAVYVFYIINWPAQDYYAPQALAYLFYLTGAAILLIWLTPKGDLRGARLPTQAEDDPLTMEQIGVRTQRVWLVVTIMLLFAAMTSAHQLTPFALMFLMATFILFRYTNHRRPLIFMAVLVSGWVVYVAAPYIAGRLSDLLAAVGAVETIADEAVVTRFGGGPLRMIVVGSRLVMSVGVWCAAFLGFLVARGRVPHVFKFALGVVATMPLIALQPYGGEMPIRVYLYSMPFSAVLIAAGLVRLSYPTRGDTSFREHRLRYSAAMMIVIVGLFSGFLVSRYGNAAVEYFTTDDVAAIDYLYENAPYGSLLLSVSENVPWKAQHYTDYLHRTVVRVLREGKGAPVVPLVQEYVAEKGGGGAYLIVTDSGIRYLESGGIMTEEAVRQMEADLVAAGNMTLVYENETARIYLMVDGSGSEGSTG